jgi:hypothetical protein
MMAGSTQVCKKKKYWNMNSPWNKVNSTSLPCTVWLHDKCSCARHKSKFYKLLNLDVPFITAQRIILINSKLFICYVKYIKLSRRQEKTRLTRHKNQIFLIFCVFSFFVAKRNILWPQWVRSRKCLVKKDSLPLSLL